MQRYATAVPLTAIARLIVIAVMASSQQTKDADA